MKKMVVWGMLAALALGVSGAAAQPVMATDPPESGEEAEGPETNNGSLGASDLCNDDRIDDALKKAAGCKDTQRADELANTIINVAQGLVWLWPPVWIRHFPSWEPKPMEIFLIAPP